MLGQFGRSAQPKLSLEVLAMKGESIDGDIQAKGNFFGGSAPSNQL